MKPKASNRVPGDVTKVTKTETKPAVPSVPAKPYVKPQKFNNLEYLAKKHQDLLKKQEADKLKFAKEVKQRERDLIAKQKERKADKKQHMGRTHKGQVKLSSKMPALLDKIKSMHK